MEPSSVWEVRPTRSEQARTLAHALDVHPRTAQLLVNRGVTSPNEAERFLHPSLDALEDPIQLPDMARAVARLRRAIARQESILIFGDSDVDGLTANVILYEVLRELGAVVRSRQSNRIADGYGVPASLVRQICRTSTALVVLVDCGTNQADVVCELAAHGIETIIVDHHVPLEDAAKPLALINPHAHASARWRELSSAGLAFKVAHALLTDSHEESLAACVDLAALGMLADYAPLVGESRAIIASGLMRIVQSLRPGLRRLCEATQTTSADPEQIARRLIPRLNASGRLGDPAAIWHLLLREDDGRADQWLAATEAAHTTTKGLHRQMIGEAYEQVNRLNFRDEYVLVVSGRSWHRGLMGPLASQLAQRYSRPTIALAMDAHSGTGSGRSIPLFNLLEALQACQGLLVRFGGHAQACGLTLDRQHLEAFRAQVNQRARHSLGREALVRTRLFDLELELGEIQPRWVEESERLAPFGQGNPRPSVLIRGVSIEVHSPRTATLHDGTTALPARGNWIGVEGSRRYDVAASPVMTAGRPMLTVSDVKGAAAL